MATSIAQAFSRGLWKEIPPFRLVLGLCPVLGVTTTMENGIGMGLATTFVLVCSNILVSLLRKVIPRSVRIPCFIIIIATFVTVTELLMQAYTYGLYQKLGIFIPLIVVCLLSYIPIFYLYKRAGLTHKIFLAYHFFCSIIIALAIFVLNIFIIFMVERKKEIIND